MADGGGAPAMTMPPLGPLRAFNGKGSAGSSWTPDRQQVPPLAMDFASREELLASAGLGGLLPPLGSAAMPLDARSPPPPSHKMSQGLEGQYTREQLQAALQFSMQHGADLGSLLPGAFPPELFYGDGSGEVPLEDEDEVEILSPEELEMASLCPDDLEALRKSLPEGDLSRFYAMEDFAARSMGASSSSSSRGPAALGAGSLGPAAALGAGSLGPGGLLGLNMAMQHLSMPQMPPPADKGPPPASSQASASAASSSAPAAQHLPMPIGAPLAPSGPPTSSSQTVPPLNLGNIGMQASSSSSGVAARFDGPAAAKGPEVGTDPRFNYAESEDELHSTGEAGVGYDRGSPSAPGGQDFGPEDYEQGSAGPSVEQDVDGRALLEGEAEEEEEEDDEVPWRPPASLLKQTVMEEEDDEDEDDLRNYFMPDISEEEPKVPSVALHELVFRTQAFLSGDESLEPRGACECRRCERWVCHHHSRQLLRWWPPDRAGEQENFGDGHDLKEQIPDKCACCGCSSKAHASLQPWMREVADCVDRFRALPSDDGEKPKGISGSMIMAKRLRARPLRRLMRLPAVVPHWETTDAAFFLITEGAYDPRLDGRGRSRASTASPAAACADPSSVFVSVICPTTDTRHAFHPLLYANFARQTHERRELIVIDTGRRPSPFFAEMVAQDPRITYKFYPCSDPPEDEYFARQQVEEQQRVFVGLRNRRVMHRQEACLTSSGRSRRSMEERLGLRQGTYEDRFRRELARSQRKPTTNCWSLGLKRNLACHLARGAVIAHFDDDDLYAPEYLACMLRNLLQRGCKPGRRRAFSSALESSSGGGGGGGGGSSGSSCCGSSGNDQPLGPALAKLCEWHLMDLADQSFGFLSPKSDPLIPSSARESMVLGYGFSYVYTRAAWELCPFPDSDWCEDGEFVAELRRRKVPILMVRSDPKLCAHGGGLAAHVYHRYTTSGGEFAGFLRLGNPVPVPGDFKELLPLLKQLAQVTASRTSECHWLRRELIDQAMIRCPPVELGLGKKAQLTEVGLAAKEKLIRKGLLYLQRPMAQGASLEPPGARRTFPAGGFHLRTAPPSRARSEADGRQSETASFFASARSSGPSPLLQFVNLGNLMGHPQTQLYTQEVD